MTRQSRDMVTNPFPLLLATYSILLTLIILIGWDSIHLVCAQTDNGWEIFQKQHVPDPKTDKNYWTWNRNTWNNWLQNRLKGTGPSSYGVKEINSVMAAQPDYISADFKSATKSETKGSQTLWWSSKKYNLYVFKLVTKNNKKSYDGWACSNKYVLAARNQQSNLPYHMDGYSTTNSGAASNTNDCKPIK